jgi:omega-amidase
MQIDLHQSDVLWEQSAANLDACAAGISGRAIRPGGLVVFPEMFSTGFSMNAEKIAENSSNDAPACGWLIETANDLGCCVVGGAAVREDGRFYNEAIAAFPGGDVARYQKHQTFSPGSESEVFSKGERLITFGWQDWTVGLTVCYDLRFPEIYRSLAAAGAEIIVNIANWPTARVDHWVTLLRARAIENQCYIAGVNRVGKDPNTDYPGRSLIVDPQGKIVADAGDAAGIASADLDLESLREWRRSFPALADARNLTAPVIHHRVRSAN